MKPRPRKLLEQVSDLLRVKHYSYCTKQTYIQWIWRYILFHNKTHPKNMGSPKIKAFLTHLAVQEQVAASTQNQALSAILFLYREVLRQGLDRCEFFLNSSWNFICPEVGSQFSVGENRPCFGK